MKKPTLLGVLAISMGGMNLSTMDICGLMYIAAISSNNLRIRIMGTL